MRSIDHVCDVLEIHVGVAANEGYLFRTFQIYLCQAHFEIFPAHVVLVNLYCWRLILRRPDHRDDDGAGLRDVLRLLLIRLWNLRGLTLFLYPSTRQP